jgi:hypothetical protein
MRPRIESLWSSHYLEGGRIVMRLASQLVPVRYDRSPLNLSSLSDDILPKRT